MISTLYTVWSNSEMSEFDSNSGSSNNPKHKLTSAGITILGVSGALALGFYAVVTPFLTPALRKICLPFVPATSTQLKNVKQALKNRNGSLLDIGSGDGRIVSIETEKCMCNYIKILKN